MDINETPESPKKSPQGTDCNREAVESHEDLGDRWELCRDASEAGIEGAREVSEVLDLFSKIVNMGLSETCGDVEEGSDSIRNSHVSSARVTHQAVPVAVSSSVNHTHKPLPAVPASQSYTASDLSQLSQSCSESDQSQTPTTTPVSVHKPLPAVPHSQSTASDLSQLSQSCTTELDQSQTTVPIPVSALKDLLAEPSLGAPDERLDMSHSPSHVSSVPSADKPAVSAVKLSGQKTSQLNTSQLNKSQIDTSQLDTSKSSPRAASVPPPVPPHRGQTKALSLASPPSNKPTLMSITPQTPPPVPAHNTSKDHQHVESSDPSGRSNLPSGVSELAHPDHSQTPHKQDMSKSSREPDERNSSSLFSSSPQKNTPQRPNKSTKPPTRPKPPTFPKPKPKVEKDIAPQSTSEQKPEQIADIDSSLVVEDTVRDIQIEVHGAVSKTSPVKASRPSEHAVVPLSPEVIADLGTSPVVHGAVSKITSVKSSRPSEPAVTPQSPEVSADLGTSPVVQSPATGVSEMSPAKEGPPSVVIPQSSGPTAGLADSQVSSQGITSSPQTTPAKSSKAATTRPSKPPPPRPKVPPPRPRAPPSRALITTSPARPQTGESPSTAQTTAAPVSGSTNFAPPPAPVLSPEQNASRAPESSSSSNVAPVVPVYGEPPPPYSSPPSTPSQVLPTSPGPPPYSPGGWQQTPAGSGPPAYSLGGFTASPPEMVLPPYHVVANAGASSNISLGTSSRRLESDFGISPSTTPEQLPYASRSNDRRRADLAALERAEIEQVRLMYETLRNRQGGTTSTPQSDLDRSRGIRSDRQDNFRSNPPPPPPTSSYYQDDLSLSSSQLSILDESHLIGSSRRSAVRAESSGRPDRELASAITRPKDGSYYSLSIGPRRDREVSGAAAETPSGSLRNPSQSPKKRHKKARARLRAQTQECRVPDSSNIDIDTRRGEGRHLAVDSVTTIVGGVPVESYRPRQTASRSNDRTTGQSRETTFGTISGDIGDVPYSEHPDSSISQRRHRQNPRNSGRSNRRHTTVIPSQDLSSYPSSQSIFGTDTSDQSKGRVSHETTV